jgi:arylsulfatase A-like enzyme
MLGEYAAGYGPNDLPAAGWDEWDVASATRSGFDYDLHDENGSVQHYGRSPADYLINVLAAKAGEFIASAARDGKPYALVVAPPAPGPVIAPAPRLKNTFPQLGAPRGPAFGRLPSHPPAWLATLPPLSGADLLRLDADYERRVEAVQSLDLLVRHIGRAVHAGPSADNTYVVVSSDSAYHEGEHRLLSGSGTAFDTDIRAPLIVRGPDVAPNATVDALASSIDLAPTFEGLAGVRPTTGSDGTSLTPLLQGTVPAGWQQAALIEQPAGALQQPARSGRPPGFLAVRTADSLYVSYAGGDDEYYNLADDPAEVHNLAATASAGQLGRLRATLAALRSCSGTTRCQAAAAR